ncbi:hypothetical protein Zm00014a_017583 [Zea mays]|uniref:Uncharacterized protein n=1 Tax=Zea mays TaxID=4577 RepID=A0A3L6DMI6_MAIZE|nr:hypothetical protein Zm00014a_017583 [Zea mays]
MPPARWAPSWAANATTSAQETVRGQCASRTALASSTTSKPRMLGLFATESFSATLPGMESRRMEPSQPRTKQSWKCMRTSPAPTPESRARPRWTALRTISSACGHECL